MYGRARGIPPYTLQEDTMVETLTEATVSLARPQPSVEDQKRYAEAAAHALEALVARLSAGDGFAEKFAAHPRATLGAAGIVLQKEAVEFLMIHDPDRFDQVCDALFDLLDPDILNSLVG